jgi:hypothetical protein
VGGSCERAVDAPAAYNASGSFGSACAFRATDATDAFAGRQQWATSGNIAASAITRAG